MFSKLVGLSPRLPFARLAATGVFLCSLIIHCACSQQPTQAVPESTRATSTKAQARDLAADEERGGHTLRRHVGKSDMELQARLARERNISAASTYSDSSTAESVIAEAVTANQRRIQQWLQGSGGHPNLVLDYDGSEPVGRSLRRNVERSQPCSHAVVVLKWVAADDFIVLTSYPECR
jgi:hypothetical protein